MKENLCYHYTYLEKLEGILETKTLRFGSLSMMDDEIDKLYGNLITLIFYSDAHANKDIKDKINSEPITREFILKYFDESYLDKQYCMSFAEEFDNKLMWKAYSENDKGICIGVNVNLLDKYFNNKIQKIDIEGFANDGFLIYREKVIYGYEYKKIEKLVENMLVQDYRKKIPMKQILDYLGFSLSGCTKSKKWEYQKEQRILIKEIYEGRGIKLSNFARACGVQVDLEDYEKETIEKIKEILFFGGEKEIDGKKYYVADISKISLSELFPCVYVKNVETKDEIKKLFIKYNLTDIKIKILKLEFENSTK